MLTTILTLWVLCPLLLVLWLTRYDRDLERDQARRG